jgi:hypothetical protein
MTLVRPMFPPRAECVDSFSLQPSIGDRHSQTLTGGSPTPVEALAIPHGPDDVNLDAIGRGGWHYELRATMAAAIEALIKAQPGKAVRA